MGDQDVTIDQDVKMEDCNPPFPAPPSPAFVRDCSLASAHRKEWRESREKKVTLFIKQLKELCPTWQLVFQDKACGITTWVNIILLENDEKYQQTANEAKGWLSWTVMGTENKEEHRTRLKNYFETIWTKHMCDKSLDTLYEQKEEKGYSDKLFQLEQQCSRRILRVRRQTRLGLRV